MVLLLRSLRRMDLILRFSRTISQSPINHFYPKFWKCALAQMYSYLLQNDLFPSSPSAYRKDNSTETALLRSTNDILQATDKHEDTILVLLDLSAAFDTIDHEVLLNRLNPRFGFRDLALKWLASYLADRRQSVRIRSAVSVDSQLCFGVPQGSVLGPVLFSSCMLLQLRISSFPMAFVPCSMLMIVRFTSQCGLEIEMYPSVKLKIV